jgi:type IV secretory pathway TrbD component
MASFSENELIPGFEAPVHRALTEPILLAGAPRTVAILNGTLSAAIGLGLRLWVAGLVLWAIGHAAAVWAAKRDPAFVEVVRRHVRYPLHLGA